MNKIMYKRITLCLSKNPTALPPVQRQLQDLGCLGQDGEVAVGKQAVPGVVKAAPRDSPDGHDHSAEQPLSPPSDDSSDAHNGSPALKVNEENSRAKEKQIPGAATAREPWASLSVFLQPDTNRTA